MNNTDVGSVLLENRINELKSQLSIQKLITERQAEHIFNLKLQLNESKKENAELYDFNSVMYFTIDSNYIIQNVNIKASLFFGIERQKLINKLFINFITFNSKNNFQIAMQKLIDEQFKQTCEIEVMHKGVNKKYIFMECTLLQNNLIRLALTDITSTRKFEIHIFSLKKSLHLVNDLFQYASDAMAALDSELNIKIANKSFANVFSDIFSIQIQLGMSINKALFDFPSVRLQIISACQEACSTNNASINIENNNNQIYYCYELTIIAMSNKYSKKKDFIFCIKNRTEMKLEERRQHKRQTDMALACRVSTMGEMASAFSHEINQPLTVIVTYSRSCLFILKKNMDAQTTCEKLIFPLEQIARQAEHAGEIINNMRNFMRNTSLHVEPTDINTLIKETLTTLNYELLDSNLKITLDLADDLPKAMTNKIHIMQIILNLIRNSIEALQNSPEIKPELVINTLELNEQIAVRIIDNGPGIPVEFQDKILNTYFTTKSQGTGIGLGICRSLIEAHGGCISVEKDRKQGACFTFTLPIIKH